MSAYASARRVFVITGASGFIGRRVVEHLLSGDATCRVLTRRKTVPRFAAPISSQGASPSKLEIIRGDLAEPGSLRHLCDGVDAVIHLAGYAHADDADTPAAAARHRQVTVEGTRALLVEAVRAGVERFIFASSVKAMGENTTDCLDENAPAQPAGAYGRSKREAEELVLAAGREHGMHVSVLRLPLVYGPGNKGNLARMIESIARNRFPPPPEVHNKRSMVHVDDVVQALFLATVNDRANGRVYIVTDGQAYSVRELYVLIRRALGRNAPRWSVPAGVWRAAAGCGDVLERLFPIRAPLTSPALEKLFGSAWYCSDAIQRDLGFRPLHTFAEALHEMVEDYRRQILRRTT